MFTSRWIGPKCRNPEVTAVHHQPCAVAYSDSASRATSSEYMLCSMLPEAFALNANAITFTAIRE
ncbi:hypothetical protein MTP03_27840 [Tsukamurella sp. PLM1]|nr:hypothetical protein MTP03_27840 [Tsukamurella sp. PLM1]